MKMAGFTVCKDYVSAIIKGVNPVQLRNHYLKNKDDFYGLYSLECFICVNIPIDPVACKRCRLIFCKGCLDAQRFIQYPQGKAINNEEIEKLLCPEYHIFMQPEPLPLHFTENIYGKMLFSHKCVDSLPTDQVMKANEP